MNEEILKQLAKTIVNRNEADKHNNNMTSYTELEKSKNQIFNTIKQLNDVLKLTDNIKKDDKEFNNVPCVKKLNRDEITELFGFNIFDGINFKTHRDGNKILFDDKKTVNQTSNRIVKANITLKKNNQRLQTISHTKNQYKIFVNIPAEYFK